MSFNAKARVRAGNLSNTGIRPVVLEQIRCHAKRCGIHTVILFGSRARGTFHRDSDIDLAVSGGNVDLFRLAVEEETDPLLGWRAIRVSLAKPELFKPDLHPIFLSLCFSPCEIL